MATYIKNDINFHGARSKTSVAENPSAKKNFTSKNKKMDDDGWGSIPNSTVNNNTGDGWGEKPSDGLIHDNAWGQERLVYGKSERNRKFRLDNDNSSFRVHNQQSVPNWEEADTEFPSLGRRQDPPVANVWEKRKRKFEEKAAIVPTSETEEEMMVRQAMEMSMRDAQLDEERRRQLEEEYRLQTELLEANPDMFNEFRADQNEFSSATSGFVDQVPANYTENFPNDEKVNYDQCAWGYSSKKTTKEKGRNQTEDMRKVKEDFPQLKTNSAKPSFNGTTQSKNKTSKAIEMFGGWGSPKPFTHQNAVVAKTSSKPSQWDTVDTEFVPLPSKKTVVEEKPNVEPSTPPSLEVKLENTSIWDSVDAIHTTTTSETRNNLGTRDTVELNLKDSEPGYSLDQKEKEFETQSKRKKSKPKMARRTVAKGNNLVSEEDKSKTSVQNVGRITEVKGDNFVSGEDRCKTSVQKVDPRLDDSCDRLSSEHSNQKNSSMEVQSIPQETNSGTKSKGNGASAKSEIDSYGSKSEIGLLQNECPDSQKSVECDYAFLLNQIDATNTKTQSEDLSPKHSIEIKNSSKNSLPEIYQTTFSIDNFLAEATPSEVSHIPEPIPFSIEPPSAVNPNLMSANNRPDMNSWQEPNSNDFFKIPDAINDAPPLHTFGGYPTNPESLNLPGQTFRTNLNEARSLPTFGRFPPNPEVNSMPVAENGATHIEQPSVPRPTPEFANPAFFMQPRPVLAPMMNPAYMMGMNPLMMQQMMLTYPFFVQQLQQMSMGMPVLPGMPLFPQPMPVPAYNAQNFHSFNAGNIHELCNNGTSGPMEENDLIQRPANQPPGAGAAPSQPEKVPPPTAEQQATESFWFEDFMSADPVIPPPIPTSNEAQSNPDILPDTFAAMSLQGEEMPTNQELSESIIPDQLTYVPSQSPVATGWGDIDADAKSESSLGWNDSVDGWGGSDTTTKAMRNSSRYVPENRATCRQPTSRPYLGRPKS